MFLPPEVVARLYGEGRCTFLPKHWVAAQYIPQSLLAHTQKLILLLCHAFASAFRLNMISQQLAQFGQPPAHLQSQDFDTLSLALSGLTLGDKSTQHVNINGADTEATVTLPLSNNAVFGQSSYFGNNTGQTSLPRPAIIRDHATFLISDLQANTHGITHVPIPSQRLLVKYGAKVSTVEAACLVQLRRLLGAHVPVPEVFGWCLDGNETFIYMDLPQGMTLDIGWPFLSEGQKMEICSQLRDMAAAWRGLEQGGAQAIGQGWVGKAAAVCPSKPNSNTHIRAGNPTHGALQDSMFATLSSHAGPFPTVSAFHEWFVSTAMQASASRQGSAATSLCHFPSDYFRPETPVSFTHGNLHPSNIVISTKTAHPRVVAVLDWSQAGWYPAYWERFKARKAARSGGNTVLRGWEDTYLPHILDPQGDGTESWGSTQDWDYLVGFLERAG